MTAADPRHVLETDIAAGGVDHDVPHIRGSLELVDGADKVLRLAILQPAAGEVDVLGGKTGNDLARAETQIRNAAFVELNVDLLFEATAHENRSHAFHALEKTFHVLLTDQSQANEIFVAVKTQPHDRIE